jgi:hypothetical protein
MSVGIMVKAGGQWIPVTQAQFDGIRKRPPVLVFNPAIAPYNAPRSNGKPGFVGFYDPPENVNNSSSRGYIIDLGDDWDQYRSWLLSVSGDGAGSVSFSTFLSENEVRNMRTTYLAAVTTTGIASVTVGQTTACVALLMTQGRYVQVSIANYSGGVRSYQMQVTAYPT